MWLDCPLTFVNPRETAIRPTKQCVVMIGVFLSSESSRGCRCCAIYNGRSATGMEQWNRVGPFDVGGWV